jgi:Domain of unknown function (DUF1844)
MSETTVPPATFLNFLSGLGAQGLMQVGALANPLTGERSLNLPYARYTVELLAVLKAKSEGHRTAEEDQYLNGILTDLRQRLEQAER